MESVYLVLQGVSPSIWSHQITSEPLQVGRQKICDVFLHHDTVSRVHAEFCEKGKQFWVKDLGSRNGTFVNGTSVVESTIKVGDRIQLGDVVLNVVNTSVILNSTGMLQRKATSVSIQNPQLPSYEKLISQLTETQSRVLAELLKGKSEKMLAAEWEVSQHTIHSHVKAIYEQLKVSTRAELLAKFINPATMGFSDEDNRFDGAVVPEPSESSDVVQDD